MVFVDSAIVLHGAHAVTHVAVGVNVAARYPLIRALHDPNIKGGSVTKSSECAKVIP